MVVEILIMKRIIDYNNGFTSYEYFMQRKAHEPPYGFFSDFSKVLKY